MQPAAKTDVARYTLDQSDKGYQSLTFPYHDSSYVTPNGYYGRVVRLVKNTCLASTKMGSDSSEVTFAIEYAPLASMKNISFRICEMRDSLVLLQLSGSRLKEEPRARKVEVKDSFTQLLCYHIDQKRVRWSTDGKERYHREISSKAYFAESHKIMQHGACQNFIYSVAETVNGSPQKILLRDWETGKVKFTIQGQPNRTLFACREIGSEQVVVIGSTNTQDKRVYDLYVKNEHEYHHDCSFDLLSLDMEHNRLLVQVEGSQLLSLYTVEAGVVKKCDLTISPLQECTYQMAASKIARYDKQNGLVLINTDANPPTTRKVNTDLQPGFVLSEHQLYDDFLLYATVGKEMGETRKKFFLVDCQTYRQVEKPERSSKTVDTFIGREGNLLFFFDGTRVYAWNKDSRGEKYLFWTSDQPLYKNGLFTYIVHSNEKPTSYEIENFLASSQPKKRTTGAYVSFP